MADIMIKLTLLKKHPNLLKNNNEVNEQEKLKKKKRGGDLKISVYFGEKCSFFFSLSSNMFHS